MLKKIKTKDQLEIIIGIIGLGDINSKLKDITEKFGGIVFNNNYDIYDIDYLMAEQLLKLSNNSMKFVGASIYIPGYINSTGGIIGSPNKDISSSNKEVEKLEEDIYMITLPGGPGVICNIDKNNRDSFIHRLKRLMIENTSRGKILDLLNEKTEMFLYVEDGTGNDDKGGVAIKCGNEIDYIFFERRKK